jgi:dihydroorotase
MRPSPQSIINSYHQKQPNLVPPITTVAQCLAYKAKLEALAPNVTFLMSLYLHPDITPETIIAAKKAGIAGVKSYPAGVTTNSSAGIIDYEKFHPVFAEMERQDLVLNLHGECPPAHGITVLNAEEKFLPKLLELHARFPRLRIVLEHCTTAAAVATVRSCSTYVVATITAHHLWLIIDDVVGNNHAFCKPVAKTDDDRAALLRAVVAGEPKFFLGTDSAPHPRSAKEGPGGRAAAGVFTQPYATQMVLDALEMAVEAKIIDDAQVSPEGLAGFLGEFGRAFYKVQGGKAETIELTRGGDVVVDLLRRGEVEVVPFRRGEATWKVTWT